MYVTVSLKLKLVKLNDMALPAKASQSYMGSHSVTRHPSQVNSPRLTPAGQAGTRFTYPRGIEG